MRKPVLSLGLIFALLLAPLSLRTPLAQTAAATPVVAGAAVAPATTPSARVIVKYKADSTLARRSIQSVGAASVSAESAVLQLSGQAQALGQRIGIPLSAGASVSDRSHVVFTSGMTSAQLAQRLASESDIEYAVPDVFRKRFSTPNDPFYQSKPAVLTTTPKTGGPTVGQWYLRAPGPATPVPTASTTNTAPSSINAEGAWDITTGSASIVVAVLDTGIRFDHTDFKLAANGGNILAGYDMVSGDGDGTFTTANDGDGRDADASDPGDFVLTTDVGKGGCKSSDLDPTTGGTNRSSWHGTETAGLIGALTDNSVGIASVGRNVRILPVRVLGKCGGYDSDIVAGMLWAANVSTPTGVPANSTPARVINLSLGGSGACDSTAQLYVDAVRQVTAAGTVVVASAGNSEGHAVSLPADCAGVIAVAGLRHIGTKVGFSDLGPEITISAPGGNCVNITGSNPECVYPIVSTTNSGVTAPTLGATGAVYTDSFLRPSLGTSFSSPLVAGSVALMLSVQPLLTPGEVRAKLQSTARNFPQPTVDESGALVAACFAPTTGSANQDQCVCQTGLCGAGMLDAHAATLAAGGVQARIAVSPATPTIGQPVTFDSAPSLAPVTAGATIVSRQWSLSSGGGAVTALSSPTNGPTVTATPTAPGTFVVALTETDSSGVVSTTTASVTLAAPPAPSSGGGGALGAGWLLLLLAAVLALRFAPVAPARG